MIRREGERLLVEGPLTMHTVPDLVAGAGEHFSAGVSQADFGRVTDVDSSAVALALEWKRQAAGSGLNLRLENLPRAMQNLARLYGVSELL
ncbi:MAG: STAS domain-containing protein [Burkholderiales bacterium]|nr:STAS domain-containing protein [Burkholderiales bacterium]